MDALEAGRLRIQSDVVLFDAPWYLADVVGWLFAASQLVKLGGTIVFALYPPLLRPTSQLERNFLLDLASSIGSVRIEEDAIVYETPLFEQEALKSFGLPCVSEWRRADVVSVTLCNHGAYSLSHSFVRSSIDGDWISFVVDEQVVKVRSRPSLPPNCDRIKDILQPVGTNFLFSSVSARSAQRDCIDVWTSRNRVASSSNTDVLCHILGRLARGESLNRAVRAYASLLPMDCERQMREFLVMEV